MQLQRLILQVQRVVRGILARANAMVLLVGLPLLAIVLSLATYVGAPVQTMGLSELARAIHDGSVKTLAIEDTSLTVTDQSGAVRVVAFRGDVVQLLRLLDVTPDELARVELRGREAGLADAIGPALSRALIAFLLVALWLYLQATIAVVKPAAVAVKSGRGRRVRFDDVAGLDEAKEELREIVTFLQDPRRFAAFGAQVPRGILLVGPPGNGKTLLARAVAGEAEVEFLAASGSDFVEVYVGRGASRVRALFDQARRRVPCVVFVDELDSLGRHRGSANAENDHALNQLLVEMDGFATDQRVVILAATNRADMLDPALLRPGRFDRRVTVPLPDIRAREEILRLHARGKPMSPEVDLSALARVTTGLSGADLANVMNEAAILAVRRNKSLIEPGDVSEAVDRTLVGPTRRGELIPARDREVLAYHEAGHTLVAHRTGEGEVVQKVSIVARGMAGGFTRLMQPDDSQLWSRQRCQTALVWLLGGRAAESIVFDDVTTGAQDDLRRVTALARAMVTAYGMSDRVGPLTVDATAPAGAATAIGAPGRPVSVSPQLAALIDEEVQSLVREADAQARLLLRTERAHLDRIARALLAEETLEGERLRTLLAEAADG